MNYDGILFDLDGTLWNATRSLAASWTEVLRQIPDVTHIPTVEEFEGVMGMTNESLVQTLFPYLPLSRGLEIFDLCVEAEIRYLAEHGGILYNGIEELFETLSSKLPLFIVSNCNAGYIESFLTAHHFDRYIKDHECIGRTGLQKCDNIRLVVERNHLQKPVYVGDTEMDAHSAELAGVPFIHAAYGFGEVDTTQKIHTPLELLQLL